MQRLKQCTLLILMMLNLGVASASICGVTPNSNCPPPRYNSCPRGCETNTCCGQMGGVQYCDSSAGRLVCNNGYYSSCYCTRHAIMDLQRIEGCCIWQGGVLNIDEMGLVVCNNGGISEECSLQSKPETYATW